MVPAQTLWFAVARPDHIADRGCDRALKDGVPLGNFQKLVRGIVDSSSGLSRFLNPDAHQVINVLIRKRIQHDRMHDAIHRCGGHDTECKGEHGHSSESGILEKHSNRVAKVVDHSRFQASGSRC